DFKAKQKSSTLVLRNTLASTRPRETTLETRFAKPKNLETSSFLLSLSLPLLSEPRILQLLRLLQINTGVFVRLTKATKQKLQLIEPYVTYGEPSLKTIKEIISNVVMRIRLSDNTIVEKNLGKYGISVLKILSIKSLLLLSSPNGGFKGKKAVHFIRGGESGDREIAINSLVKKMN
ncbi:60S ribosomal protein L7, partial [Entomophthora muscae]